MSWDIIYYEVSDGTVPAIEFLRECPTTVRATILAVLDAVAAAPPPSFSGGGKWEAMHGDMGGFYEVRVTGPNRDQFRLFCILENATTKELKERGLTRPVIAVIAGMKKPIGKKFKPADYRRVRRQGEQYLAQKPRRYAQ